MIVGYPDREPREEAALALQQRLIQRRVALWNGRISEFAAAKTLQMYEFMVLAYLSVILCVAVACVCILASADTASAAFFLVALICGVLFISLALRAGRAGARDITRQYGLPPGAWRRVKLKTPEQFDRWLSSQRRVP